MTARELSRRLAQACAEQEGFFVTEAEAKARKIRWPTAAQRYNNPGNIMDYAHFKKTQEFRLQHYKSLQSGWNAAYAWWQRRFKEGYTLEKAIYRYAPKEHSGNNPEKYIVLILSKLPQLKRDVPLKDYLDA